MVKVVVLGSTGMLGNAVTKVLSASKRLEIYTSFRKKEFKWDDKSFYFDALETPLDKIPQCEYLINCIGTIKPYMLKDLSKSIYINSIFPHQLAKHCKEKNIKMIHITTDCVFSGKDGKYNEDSFHDCLDEYGKSKSLGETKECMVIRTSIIGEEIHSNSSLIEWVKSMKGKNINGFTNHYWNGITTVQYGKICKKIINDNLFQNGLFHVYSDDVTKMKLVSIINKLYDLNITITPFEANSFCDRTMRSNKGLNKLLNIPSLKDQIKQMRNFY